MNDIESSFITNDLIEDNKPDITSNLNINFDNENDSLFKPEYSSYLNSDSNLENKSNLPSYKEIINQNGLEEDNQNMTKLRETTEILFDAKKNKHSNVIEESSLNISKGNSYENTQMSDITSSNKEKLFETSNTYENLNTNIDSDISKENSVNYSEILIPSTEEIFSEKTASSLLETQREETFLTDKNSENITTDKFSEITKTSIIPDKTSDISETESSNKNSYLPINNSEIIFTNEISKDINHQSNLAKISHNIISDDKFNDNMNTQKIISKSNTEKIFTEIITEAKELLVNKTILDKSEETFTDEKTDLNIEKRISETIFPEKPKITYDTEQTILSEEINLEKTKIMNKSSEEKIFKIKTENTNTNSISGKTDTEEIFTEKLSTNKDKEEKSINKISESIISDKIKESFISTTEELFTDEKSYIRESNSEESLTNKASEPQIKSGEETSHIVPSNTIKPEKLSEKISTEKTMNETNENIFSDKPSEISFTNKETKESTNFSDIITQKIKFTNKKSEEEIFTQEKSISSIPNIINNTIIKESSITINKTEDIFTDAIKTNKETLDIDENIENSKKMIIKTNIEKSIINESDEEIFTDETSSQEFNDKTTNNNLNMTQTYYNDNKEDNLFSNKAQEVTIINDYTDNLLLSDETQKETFTDKKIEEKNTNGELDEISDFNIKTEIISTIKEKSEEITIIENTKGFITDEKIIINPTEEKVIVIDTIIHQANTTEVIFNEKESNTINITNIINSQESTKELDNITSNLITTTEILLKKVIIIPTKLTKEQIMRDLSAILVDKKIGVSYKYSGPNYTLIIKPINSEEFSKESSSINFTKCEKKLREKYNIPDSEILTIIQLEINSENLQVLTNQVEYKLFDAHKKPLDISICKDSDIVLSQIMNPNSLKTLKLDLVKEFENLDINVFDINDPFFTDLCKPFDYRNNDIILEDRYHFIYQNFSFCEKGCNISDIDFDKNIVSCQCKVKQEMNTENAEQNFQYIDSNKLKNSNIDVIKCTDLIFDLKNKSKNAGFILFSILVIIFIILIIIHIYRGIKPVVDFVYNEMRKYNYLKKDDRKFFEEIKKDKVTKFKNYKAKKTITNGNLSSANNNIGGPRTILSKKKKQPKKAKNLMELNKLNKSKSKLSNFSSQRNLAFNSNLLFQNNQNILEEPKLNPPIKKIAKKKKKSISINKSKKNNNKSNKKPNATVLEVLNDDKEKKKKDGVDNFGIIKIDLNEIKKNYYPKDSYRTLHNYTYKEATKFDHRNVCQVLYIFLLAKQILFHTFLEKSPLVPFQAKLGLLIFMFSFDLTLNALLYTNNNISKKYQTTKNLLSFTVSNNTMIIIISTLVSLVFISILIKLSKTEGSIRAIFRKEEAKIKKNKNYKVDYPTKMRIFSEVEEVLKKYKIRLFILFFFELIIILFCWYFVTAFCQVYSNTQKSLILNCFISILIRFVIEILICFAGAKLYTIAAQSEFLKFYNFMLFVYDLSC